MTQLPAQPPEEANFPVAPIPILPVMFELLKFNALPPLPSYNTAKLVAPPRTKLARACGNANAAIRRVKLTTTPRAGHTRVVFVRKSDKEVLVTVSKRLSLDDPGNLDGGTQVQARVVVVYAAAAPLNVTVSATMMR